YQRAGSAGCSGPFPAHQSTATARSRLTASMWDWGGRIRGAPYATVDRADIQEIRIGGMRDDGMNRPGDLVVRVKVLNLAVSRRRRPLRGPGPSGCGKRRSKENRGKDRGR